MTACALTQANNLCKSQHCHYTIMVPFRNSLGRERRLAHPSRTAFETHAHGHSPFLGRGQNPAQHSSTFSRVHTYTIGSHHVQYTMYSYSTRDRHAVPRMAAVHMTRNILQPAACKRTGFLYTTILFPRFLAFLARRRRSARPSLRCCCDTSPGSAKRRGILAASHEARS
jgi:hypothetical protein